MRQLDKHAHIDGEVGRHGDAQISRQESIQPVAHAIINAQIEEINEQTALYISLLTAKIRMK